MDRPPNLSAWLIACWILAIVGCAGLIVWVAIIRLLHLMGLF